MYAVAGVSGKTGSVVAATLLQAGKPVRVIVRDVDKANPWRQRGADVAVASLQDPKTLAAALAGVDAAYLISPQDPRSPEPISDGWRVADSIARALRETRPGHVVLLSSLVAPYPEGTGLSLTLHAAEARLADAACPITFLRAAFFLDNWLPVLGAASAGKLPTFIAPDREIPMVASRDIGLAAARALLEGPPRAPRAIAELSGPRGYSPRDLATTLSRILGRPVEPEALPLHAVVPMMTGFGASQAFAEQVRALYQCIEEGKLHGQGGDGVRTLRGTTDADTFLRSALAMGKAP
jgi:uncharacterized protein YbjT (DUF2867 family)